MNERRGEDVSKMNKRRETMEDGRRYIIYYTFGAEEDVADVKPEVEKEQADNV